MDEAILPEEEISGKRDDWVEVQNHVKALNYSAERLNELPISMRLMKEAHQICSRRKRRK